MILRVSNETRVAAIAVGTYPVRLSSRFSLVLKNCYYVPAISRNLISISSLAQNDYIIISIKTIIP